VAPTSRSGGGWWWWARRADLVDGTQEEQCARADPANMAEARWARGWAGRVVHMFSFLFCFTI